MPRLALPALALLAALAAPAPGVPAAPLEFHSVIDHSHGQPPYNGSPVRGIGRFTLNEAQDLLTYDILFDPWITSIEIASHIHLDSTGNEIFDLADGAHKVGALKITSPSFIPYLLEGKFFVRVHSADIRNGEVGGWVVPGTPALPGSWGRVKAMYRGGGAP